MGLGERGKFRRVLVKSREEVKHGGIVLLQETYNKVKKHNYNVLVNELSNKFCKC